MKKSIVALNAAIVLGFSCLSIGVPVQAESIKALQQKKLQVEDKLSGVESNISKSSDKIGELKEQQVDVKTQIAKLDASIAETTQKLNEKDRQIADTEKQIGKLNEEIVMVQDRIEKRNNILKERARSYQRSGGNLNYLEVILGASDFADFVERVGAVSTIMDADKEILKQQESDKIVLEETQVKVVAKKESLEEMKNQLVSIKTELASQKQAQKLLLAELKEQQGKEEEHKMDLVEQSQLLASQQAAIQKAMKLEKERLIAEAAEKKRLAELAKNNGGGTATLPPVSSGLFTRPANGYVSSGFGGRSLGNHFGIDIAASGNQPVVAAAAGVVSSSYYSSSYGNVVFVSHYIEGRLYTTVYAHLSSRLVSNGQTVSRGQQIGVMGNTGESYGQHLHFELHIGEWNGAKSNAVDPRRYLNL